MKYIFLADRFYSDYAHCDELVKKSDRPFIQVYLCVCGIDFAIPLRSNISHNYAFWTDEANRCGLDFTKAVVIEDSCYIDTSRKPYIRPIEHKALVGKANEIIAGMLEYINAYIDAKEKPNNHAKQRLVKFSALQYFEKHLPRVPQA